MSRERKETNTIMKPIFFKTQSELRKWFEKNHLSEPELILGYYKKGTGKETVSWSESVDQALCFGWIDSVRKSIGEESYQIRFTPRKPNSIWSNVNIKKIKELTDKGLLLPTGIEAFNKRKEEQSGIYAFENEEKKLHEVYEKQFKANKKAWEFFQQQPAGYKKLALHYVMSAKLEATRNKRFQDLITDSEAGLRMRQLSWTKK